MIGIVARTNSLLRSTGLLHVLEYLSRLLAFQEIRLAVVDDADGEVLDIDKFTFVKRIPAYNPELGFLAPFLIKDEIAMRIDNECILIYFNGLDPVRMIP